MAKQVAALPLGVKIAAVFLLIVGAFSLLAGLAVGASPLGGIAIVLGVGATAAGIGLFQRTRWGWITAVAVMTLAVVLDILTWRGLVSIPSLVLHGALLAYLLRVRAIFLSPPPEEGAWVDTTP